jgi:hypothetical protein
MSRFISAFVACLALCLTAFVASAHDIGAMRIDINWRATGDGSDDLRVDVLVDLDHTPSAIRGHFFEHLVEQSRVIVNAVPTPLQRVTDEQVVTENGVATSRRTCSFLVHSRGTRTVAWTCDLDMPEYYFVIGEASSQSRPFQWLSGGETSRTFEVSEPVAPTRRHASLSVLVRYISLGFTHIIPYGFDHVLFVLGLFLLGSTWKQLLSQVTAFTIAHSITLALSITGLASLPTRIVEPAIALSILFVAVENIVLKKFNARRVVLVFLFGLLHGMGFAGALGEVGVPRDEFAPALVGFNVGVEFGQLAVLSGAYLLVGKWFSERSWYRARIAIPACIAIACVAAFWTVQRLSA